MSANELAYELIASGGQYMMNIGFMLRQQQAEIEALKKEAALQRLSDFTQEADNEPVAWMLADKEKEHIRSIMAVQHDFVPEGCVEIPLYTHPIKELGYNNIMGTWWETMPNATSCEGVFEFARAILRKAQEK